MIPLLFGQDAGPGKDEIVVPGLASHPIKGVSMVRFTVHGTPVPQGSTRGFIPKGWTRPVITTDNKKLKPWRQQITDTALSLGLHRVAGDGSIEPIFDRDTPVEVTMNFYFTKPKTSKRRGHTVRPDGDKLVRGIFDAITGVLIVDDAQVVEFHARKHYGGPERVEIQIAEAVC